MVFVPSAFQAHVPLPPSAKGNHSFHEWWRTHAPVAAQRSSGTKKSDGNSHRIFSCVPHTPHVCGGSVSRRGLSQRTGNRAYLTGGTELAEATTPNASRSSGEGVWGRGRFSQRSGLFPRISACLSNNFSLSVEQGELFEVDEIVALLRFTLGQNRHTSGNLAARLEHQLL